MRKPIKITLIAGACVLAAGALTVAVKKVHDIKREQEEAEHNKIINDRLDEALAQLMAEEESDQE